MGLVEMMEVVVPVGQVVQQERVELMEHRVQVVLVVKTVVLVQVGLLDLLVVKNTRGGA